MNGANVRGGSRAAAASKIPAVNYYHKAVRLGCCSSPRSAPEYLSTLHYLKHLQLIDS